MVNGNVCMFAQNIDLQTEYDSLQIEWELKDQNNISFFVCCKNITHSLHSLFHLLELQWLF